MKIAIMQPYLFPYIGYWQLFSEVDVFCLLDDVNYIPRGFMARNRFFCDDSIRYFRFPVRAASQNRRICDVRLCYDKKQRENLVKTFCYAYRKASYKECAMDLISKLILADEEVFTDYVKNTLEEIGSYLNIRTPIIKASQLRESTHQKGQEGILELCGLLNAKQYVNPIGGMNLYDSQVFDKKGVELSFLRTDFEKMDKLVKSSHLDLSIVDLLFRFDKESIKQMLSCYDLVQKDF